MKRKLIVGTIVVAVVAVLVVMFVMQPRRASMVLLNGTVYTVDGSGSVVEALAIDRDRVLAAGSTESIQSSFVGDTVIDLGGRPVYPGFIDAHAHLESLGSVLATINLMGTGSVEEIQRMIAGAASRKQPGQWILGRGWDQNRWSGKQFPNHRDLDAVSGESPVYLKRVDGHAVWVNNLVLELAGVSKETPDPEGGRIIRDRNGAPTGVFIDNAIQIITAVMPQPARDERTAMVELAVKECVRYGLTEVHDMGVDSIGVLVHKELAADGRLPLRVYVALDGLGEAWRWYQTRGPEVGSSNNMLTIRAVKLYADGALGSRGAALLEPYSDDPPNRGLTLTSHGDLRNVVELALQTGFQVCVHAIGDRGNALTLDVYENAFKSLQVNGLDARFRVEHAQILHPDDIPRFARLGVIPSMQPAHCTSDMYWAESRLGPDRVRGAYAWRTLLEAGSIIPAGSDFPVESPDPLRGFFSAVTRQDQDGWPEGGWYGLQRMTREEALKAFTIWGAYAAFQEETKGSLEPGKWADLVVLSKDIMTIPANEIPDVRVQLTVVGGRVVYNADHVEM